MSARCYDRAFKYTPERNMVADYLKRKFDAIREQIAEAKAKVTTIPQLRKVGK